MNPSLPGSCTAARHPWAAHWTLLFAGLTAAAAHAAGPLGPLAGPQMGLARVRTAWHTSLPIRLSASIRSYHLVDGYIYAIASTGVVYAVRADTGEYAWARKVAEEFEVIWPPVSANLTLTADEAGAHDLAIGHSMHAVAFTRVRDVLFLDPRNGTELRRDRLPATNNASVAAAEQWLFQVSPQRRMTCLNITNGLVEWTASAHGTLSLAPVYVFGDDSLVVADDSGSLTAMSSGRMNRFSLQLGAKPHGWLAVDGRNVYVATMDRILHAVERVTGDVVWQYRLADRAEGGPIVTKDAVYQATRNEGLHRIGLERTRPNWRDPAGRAFLAELPHRVAVLQTGGRIALWDPARGEVAELLEICPSADALSNPWNDAILLTNARGEIRCLRPIGAPALTLADFRLKPVAAPSVGQPAEQAEPADQEDTEEETAVAPASASERSRPQSYDEMLLADPLRSPRRIEQ